jgi:hypothetical protein
MTVVNCVFINRLLANILLDADEKYRYKLQGKYFGLNKNSPKVHR